MQLVLSRTPQTPKNVPSEYGALLADSMCTTPDGSCVCSTVRNWSTMSMPTSGGTGMWTPRTYTSRCTWMW